MSTPAHAPGRGPLRALLLDLDGTLVDTAPDLAAALNRALTSAGRPTLALAQIRPQVSRGARALIQLGFGLDPGDPSFEPLRQAFLADYREHLAEFSRPFRGIPALLQACAASDCPWGIVTNKPAWLTRPLLQALDLQPAPACVISGDSAARPKPAPDPLLLAAAQLDLAPADCLYLGDDRRDIEAARAAGMPVLAAAWGYLGPGEDPADWGADQVIEDPAQALDWLTTRTPQRA